MDPYRPLTIQYVLEKLNTMSAAQNLDMANSPCQICKDDPKTSQENRSSPIITTDCGHYVHSLCLEEWVDDWEASNHYKCPQCDERLFNLREVILDLEGMRDDLEKRLATGKHHGDEAKKMKDLLKQTKTHLKRTEDHRNGREAASTGQKRSEETDWEPEQ